MFILFPLFLILASILGITIIAYRKMQYLKKLTPESHEVGDTIFHDLFPEMIHWFKHGHVKEYRQSFLKEIEKLLRRLRLASLKVDHASDALIKKIRKVHLSNHLEQQALRDTRMLENPPSVLNDPVEIEDPLKDLKDQEQQLIIEIAKNPKDASLYERLGDLYMSMHNREEAIEAYEAALGFNPINDVLAQKYSQLLKRKVTV